MALTKKQIKSLSFREKEILRLFKKGMNNKEIAQAITNLPSTSRTRPLIGKHPRVKTIRWHMTRIFEKCGITLNKKDAINGVKKSRKLAALLCGCKL